MVYLAIVLILAFLFWSIFAAGNFGHTFKLKDNRVFKSINNSRFGVAINYHVSALLKRKFKRLIAISLTIINKKETNLKKLSIVVEPAHTLLPVTQLVTSDEQIHPTDPQLHLAPIDIDNVDVAPNQIVSGYVFFETDEDYCDIDKLVITSDEHTEEITIRKDKIMSEKAVQFPMTR